MRKATLALALLAAAAPLPIAIGGATSALAAASTAGLAEQDKMFVEDAARGGIAEVEMGKLAEKKADNAEVKRFAERMVKDHEEANRKLESAAKGKTKGGLPTKPDEKDRMAMREAEGLSGAKFDQAYMRDQIDAHVRTVELFQREAKDGQDQELRRLAEQTLPMLQEHLKEARRVGDAIGAKS